MTLFEAPDREAPLPRVLPGDRKIQASLAEVRTLLDEASATLQSIRRARFEVDPPDNEAVRAAIRKLLEIPNRLRGAVQDLKSFTDTTPEDHTARLRVEQRITELAREGENRGAPSP
jgi:hypothetical protein